MYYYIVEPLTTATEKRKIEEIKAILSQLGIAGEFAVATPAKTVEEHLELAFSKGFTTIVGIGSDALANRVASMIIVKEYDLAVMGFIPLGGKQVLWQMLGMGSIREICEALRARFVLPIDALAIGENHVLITSAVIHTTLPTRFHLRIKKADITGKLTDATLHHSGFVDIWDSTFSLPTQGSFLQRIFGTNEGGALSHTSFTASRWELETETPCNVLVDSIPVAQTPLTVVRLPKALKLIMKRDKITKENQDSTD